jgi:hypothetical protein
VQDVAVALDLHVFRDGHRARPAHAAEVVASEVDEHHVLGALLRVALELLGEQLILAGIRAARPGAGDRVRRQTIPLGLQKQLGRGADDLEAGGPDEEQVRTRVDASQRTIERDAIERGARRGIGRQRERLASGEHDLDRFAGRDRVLGDLDGVDVRVAAQARLDRVGERGRAAAGSAPGQLGGAGSRRPFEGFEDRRLGDPVATLEVGGLGMQRGDGAEGVGEMVEDQHEVSLDEGGHRHADGVSLRERHRGFEDRDGVVAEGADRSASEARHAVGGLDPAARHERADGIEWVRGVDGLGRQVRAIRRDRDRSRLDASAAVAHLEEPAGADAQEGIAAEALAALDRLEEVGRPAVIEAQEGTDRGLQVGGAGGAQQDRVGVGGEALRLRQADRVRGAHRLASRIKNDPSSSGRKVVPSAVPPSFGVCRTHLTDGGGLPARAIGAARYRWRSAPEPTGCARQRSPFGPEAPGSISCRCRPGSHQPPDLCADARRVLVPFTARSS